MLHTAIACCDHLFDAQSHVVWPDLSSIEAYFPSDPTFLYNYAVARAAAGKYKEAEPALLSLQSGASAEELSKDYIFQMWLARCLVMNGKARQAWEIYLKMEGTQVRKLTSVSV